MKSVNQRTIEKHFPGAELVGDGPHVCISNCASPQRAFLFPDELSRDCVLRFGCGDECRGSNFHTARNVRQPVLIPPAQPWRVPGDWAP
jgi:hypothetical protein